MDSRAAGAIHKERTDELNTGELQTAFRVSAVHIGLGSETFNGIFRNPRRGCLCPRTVRLYSNGLLSKSSTAIVSVRYTLLGYPAGLKMSQELLGNDVLSFRSAAPGDICAAIDANGREGFGTARRGFSCSCQRAVKTLDQSPSVTLHIGRPNTLDDDYIDF